MPGSAGVGFAAEDRQRDRGIRDEAGGHRPQVSASEACAKVAYGEALIKATGLSMTRRSRPPNRAHSS